MRGIFRGRVWVLCLAYLLESSLPVKSMSDGEGVVSQGRLALCAWWTVEPSSWIELRRLFFLDPGVCGSRPPPRAELLPCATAEFGRAWSTDEAFITELVEAHPTNACSVSDQTASIGKGKGVLAVRGECSFHHKASKLAATGARVMVVADMSGPDSSPFPMGGTGECANDLAGLRAVMVGSEARNLTAALSAGASKGALCFGLIPRGSGPPKHGHNDPVIGLQTLAIGAVLVVIATLVSVGGKVSVETIGLSFIIVIVTWLRLATSLRQLQVQTGLSAIGISDEVEPNDIIYDHRETDELVYRVLVSRVREMGLQRGYSLEGTSVLRMLKLSRENYDFPLFHHPPAFVLASLALESLGLPYPAVPVLLSTGNLLLAIRLAFNMKLSTTGCLWTGIILAFCPISW